MYDQLEEVPDCGSDPGSADVRSDGRIDDCCGCRADISTPTPSIMRGAQQDFARASRSAMRSSSLRAAHPQRSAFDVIGNSNFLSHQKNRCQSFYITDSGLSIPL